MHKPVELAENQKFITAPQIRQATKEIAKDTSRHWAEKNKDRNPKEISPLLAIAVMNGALYFATDMQRQLWTEGVETEFDSITVSRYGAEVSASGEPAILGNVKVDPENRDLLILDTIVDQGITALFLKEYFLKRKARSVVIAALVAQVNEQLQLLQPDLSLISVGFLEKYRRWFYGYGIDYKQKFRQQPFLAMDTKDGLEASFPELNQVSVAEPVGD